MAGMMVDLLAARMAAKIAVKIAVKIAAMMAVMMAAMIAVMMAELFLSQKNLKTSFQHIADCSILEFYTISYKEVRNLLDYSYQHMRLHCLILK
jgi:hypothetical protein